LLAEKYRSEIDAILAKYPPEQKRSAVMPLLFLAQREYGYVTRAALSEIGALIDLSPTEVGSLVGFYTLYHDRQEGEYRIQICTDLPCALRGAEAFAEALCENLGLRMGETSDDGVITVEEVMCLAACDQAPMFQVQGRDGIHYHEKQSVESAMAVIRALRGEQEPQATAEQAEQAPAGEAGTPGIDDEDGADE
jgi:NADH-quinone oxidoreductase subunit E